MALRFISERRMPADLVAYHTLKVAIKRLHYSVNELQHTQLVLKQREEGEDQSIGGIRSK